VEPPIFYAPPEARNDQFIQLPDNESHHAASVMRLSQGDLVIVIDGLGTAFRGEIAEIGYRKNTTVRVHSEIRNFGEPTIILTLAASLSVGTKLDSVIEKGTELGVKRFVPVISEKSKVKLDDPKRAASRTRRLERVALAAIKQCRRSYRPDIAAPVSFTEFITQSDRESLKLIFHPADGATALGQLSRPGHTKRVTVLIGPESGFSREEVDTARQAGYQPISLGTRILRTETAGPVACALVMNFLGELK
jgi:16S rRNA (uracil1498-N3)-methyltransferase